MALKLHRCGNLWVKLGGHPCWRVQRELDAKGIDYEIVDAAGQHADAVMAGVPRDQQCTCR